MSGKISGIKIPVSVDSSGVDRGLASIDNKLRRKRFGSGDTGGGGGGGGGRGWGGGGGGDGYGGKGGGFLPSLLGIGTGAALAATQTRFKLMDKIFSVSNLNMQKRLLDKYGVEGLAQRWKSSRGKILQSVTSKIGGGFSASSAVTALGSGLGAVLGGFSVMQHVNEWRNYNKDMSSNIAALPAGYAMGSSLQRTSLDIAKRWQSTTPKQEGNYWQRLTASQPYPTRVGMDTLGTSLDIMTAPEVVGNAGIQAGLSAIPGLGPILSALYGAFNPSAAEYGYQKTHEMGVREFGDKNDLRQLKREQRRAANAAERTSI